MTEPMSREQLELQQFATDVTHEHLWRVAQTAIAYLAAKEQAERERDEARETIHREHVRPTIDEAMYRTNELLTAERRKAERAEASCAAKDRALRMIASARATTDNAALTTLGEVLTIADKALATDAGAKVLAVVQAARGAVEAWKHQNESWEAAQEAADANNALPAALDALDSGRNDVPA